MENQKLFVTGKELKEKRTQFLQARCAENQYFDMRNVGDWLLKQKNLERPTDIEAWMRIIQCNANMEGSNLEGCSQITLIRKFGLSAKKAIICVPESRLSFALHIPSILDIFGSLGYPVVTNSGIVFVSFDRNKVFNISGNRNGGAYTTNILCSDVLHSALLSWEHEGHEPAQEARNFLCSWLERRIQYVLDETGKEFDKAVAVSEDGLKILHADKVVLYAVRHSGIDVFEYEPTVFAKKKIVLGANIHRQHGLSKDFNPCEGELIEIVRKCKGGKNVTFLYDSVVVGFDPTRMFFHRIENPPCFT